MISAEEAKKATELTLGLEANAQLKLIDEGVAEATAKGHYMIRITDVSDKAREYLEDLGYQVDPGWAGDRNNGTPNYKISWD